MDETVDNIVASETGGPIDWNTNPDTGEDLFGGFDLNQLFSLDSSGNFDTSGLDSFLSGLSANDLASLYDQLGSDISDPALDSLGTSPIPSLSDLVAPSGSGITPIPGAGLPTNAGPTAPESGLDTSEVTGLGNNSVVTGPTLDATRPDTNQTVTSTAVLTPGSNGPATATIPGTNTTVVTPPTGGTSGAGGSSSGTSGSGGLNLSGLGGAAALAGIGGLLSNLLDEGDVQTKISETGLTDTVGSSNSATTGGTSSETTNRTTGGTSSLGTQDTLSTTGVEDWAKQAGQDLLSYARGLNPYARIDKTEGTVGGMLESGALGTYENPYLERVLDPMRQIDQERRAQESNQRDANAVMRGAFGGSRAMIEDQYKDYLAGRAWNENEANIRSQAYKGALDQMSGDANRNVADWTKFQEGGKDLLSAYTPALSGIAGVADRTTGTTGVTGQATTSDQTSAGTALGQNWSNTSQQSQQTAGTESAKTITEPGASKIGTALGIAGTIGNLYNTFKTV